jgi:hypothetical protein
MEPTIDLETLPTGMGLGQDRWYGLFRRLKKGVSTTPRLASVTVTRRPRVSRDHSDLNPSASPRKPYLAAP